MKFLAQQTELAFVSILSITLLAVFNAFAETKNKDSNVQSALGYVPKTTLKGTPPSLSRIEAITIASNVLNEGELALFRHAYDDLFPQAAVFTNLSHRIATETKAQLSNVSNLFSYINKAKPFHKERTGKRNPVIILEKWDTSPDGFDCIELSFFYIALSRPLGIPTFLVDVANGPDGSPGYHACVATVLGQTNFLVDPHQRVLDAKYSESYILDDVRAIGLYLSQAHRGAKPDLTHLRAAVKLYPESVLLRSP